MYENGDDIPQLLHIQYINIAIKLQTWCFNMLQNKLIQLTI